MLAFLYARTPGPPQSRSERACLRGGACGEVRYSESNLSNVYHTFLIGAVEWCGPGRLQ